MNNRFGIINIYPQQDLLGFQNLVGLIQKKPVTARFHRVVKTKNPNETNHRDFI